MKKLAVDKNAPGWTFLTNHAHVLLCLHQDDEVRLRDVAGRVGITERAVQKIIADLSGAGVIDVEREGRRNRYKIDGGKRLRHPVEAHRYVRDILRLVE